ncbi:hypothetical protein Mal15_17180 [Stieleria maiorica]|uniref:Uncharacterized protein n=1 Tax=Stieleria maiorica TaxID=2795974 RepID=A0A5B9MBV2_9BACT|nr:hypothetical protein [Stieleria maiorica]QEF97676.1 hypothetical protein Mal15_17180 [Stieleria maiorica]
MPDPILYARAILAALIASAVIVAALVWPRRSSTPAWINTASGIAIGIGLIAGLWVGSVHVSVPPATALDRLLLLILPAVLLVEWAAALPRVATGFVWLLRISLVLLVPRVLLHGSVYVNNPDEWTVWQSAITIGVCWTLLSICWGGLLTLARRSPGISIPVSLCLSLQAAAATVMMAGYLKGGEAAMPIVAALLGTAIVVWAVRGRRRGPVDERPLLLPPVLIGVGVIGLFGILFIGHFFGRVTDGRAVTIGVAPVLVWVAELRPLKQQRPWIVGAIRLALVSIPLLVTLALAKRDYDRDLAPLVVMTSVDVLTESALGSP